LKSLVDLRVKILVKLSVASDTGDSGDSDALLGSHVPLAPAVTPAGGQKWADAESCSAHIQNTTVKAMVKVVVKVVVKAVAAEISTKSRVGQGSDHAGSQSDLTTTLTITLTITLTVTLTFLFWA
jgi:hypothetical protein